MCYSKEVQLTTGSTILIFSIFYYIFFYIKYKSYQKKWLLPFLKNIIMAFSLIGIHQIFEFLSLLTNNQIIYKIGLVISISSIYFLLRSLEVILNRNLRSYIAWWLIGVVVIYIFSVPMSFEAYSFHLLHNSAFIWAAIWMLLFVYLHICAIQGRKLLDDDKTKKMIILYLFAVLDISFILSVVYTIWGYFKYSLDVCAASPSIWCTFYIVQVFTLPFFLIMLPKLFKTPTDKTNQTIKETLLIYLFSLLILVSLIAILPFFQCLSLKFVFP